MKYKLWCRYEPEMVRIKVQTYKPTKLRLIACDKDQANTKFIDAAKVVNGNEDLVIRMPLAPNYLIIQIYNESIGERPLEEEDTFKVLDIKKEDLQVTLS